MANFNFNKVILGGRLTADPELKTTTNGNMVTTFSIAVNRRNQKNTEGQSTSDFFNVTAWRNQAEFISKYFRKGSSICITGTLQNRTWTDQQNNKRYATDIVVDEVYFVDSKSENSQYQGSSDNFGAPAFTNGADSAPNFEVIADDQDLPF